MLAIWLIAGWAFALPASAQAHEKHPRPARAHPAQAAADSDTTVGLPESPPGAAAPDSPAVTPPFEMPPITEAVTHHLHNKLVHFPIVLAPLALLGLILSRSRPEIAGLARVLVWLAALSAGAALWAGLAQASDFQGEPKEWLVSVHRTLGIATTVALALAGFSAQWRETRRHAWVLALLAVILVSVGAYLGGLVSHG